MLTKNKTNTSQEPNCIKAGFFTLATLFSSSVAFGANCDANGSLSFLGSTASGNKSVWLSNTSAGSFNLVAAQGNQSVDAWSKNSKGLHLSLSPNVSNGNGGTHKLYGGANNPNCLLDTQNQKGGFTFPDSLIPPGITRPPIGSPGTPITPMLPGGVTPPIGGVPVIPTPITPMLPGGVTPPIGQVPLPTPITPMLPGGVTPPIGQVPTTPNPITPMLPGGVTPPIGALPPPGEPANPPVASNENQPQTLASKVSATTSCPAGRLPVTNTAGQILGCALPEYFNEVPLTEGRELVQEQPWNIWADSNNLSISDQRNNTDVRGKTYSASMGIDRLINNDLAAGMQISGVRTLSNAYQGDLNSNSNSYLVGPYASFRLSKAWSIYGAFGIGQQTTTMQILSLNGSSKAMQYNFALQAEGQYAVTEDVAARPKVQVSQTQVNGSNYALNGVIANTAVTLNMTNEAYKFGLVQPSLELNKLIPYGSTYVMPYVEAGIFYQYARPQGGQMLTSNLTYADTSPLGGIARMGIRALVSKTTMAKLEFSYQSIGMSNLNIWGLQAFISHAF